MWFLHALSCRKRQRGLQALAWYGRILCGVSGMQQVCQTRCVPILCAEIWSLALSGSIKSDLIRQLYQQTSLKIREHSRECSWNMSCEDVSRHIHHTESYWIILHSCFQPGFGLGGRSLPWRTLKEPSQKCPLPFWDVDCQLCQYHIA